MSNKDIAKHGKETQFKKGTSGNPRGRPPSKVPTQKEWDDMLAMNSEKCLKKIMKLINHPDTKPQDAIRACLGVMTIDLKNKEYLIKKLEAEQASLPKEEKTEQGEENVQAVVRQIRTIKTD